MCGIAGAIGGNPGQLRPVVEAMTNALSHRGPDDRRVVEVSEGAIGHARLTIIDTTDASAQPFSKHEGHWLTYNGELYNFRTLRASLSQAGHSFESTGDTEVWYELWRSENRWKMLGDTVGMFAFGFWDDHTKTLSLVRDRLGIKPLYYAVSGGVLYFASELRAMMQAGFRSLNHEVLGEFLTFQAIPGSRTLLRDVFKVMPGSVMQWQPENRNLQTRRFYDVLETKGDHSSGAGPQPGELIGRAVGERMVSDVPLGAFLSGGIDSTLVVARMQEQSEEPINTFTVGFDRQGDEREIARQAADYLGTRHHEIVCSEQEVVSSIPRAVADLDAPGGDAVNTYIVSEQTRRQGIKVALSGLGGDELFGGYPSFEFYRKFRYLRWLFRLPRSLRSAAVAILASGDAPSREKLRRLFSGRVTPEEVVRTQRSVIAPELVGELGVASGESERVLSEQCDGTWPELTKAELYYYCIPLLLQDTDQTSMAHGLEVRVPLLDHRLLAWVLADPNRAMSGSRPAKKALIHELKDRVPAAIWDRPKQGFVLPMQDWMHGSLHDFTAEGLGNSELRTVCNAERLDRLWSQFRNREAAVSWSRVWLLSVLGHWLHENRISC